MLVQQESKFFMHLSHLHPTMQVTDEHIPGIQRVLKGILLSEHGPDPTTCMHIQPQRTRKLDKANAEQLSNTGYQAA